MSSETVDMSQLLQITQNTAMSVNAQSKQMGLVLSTIEGLKKDNGEIKGTLVSVVEDVRGLKEDQFIDLVKADNIKQSAQSRVAELLEIEFDERGGIADESKAFDYHFYYPKFCGRIHVDARHAGLEGPRIYATPRRNYKALLKFINDWVPKRGVDGLKSYYDGLEAARRAKRDKRNRK